MPSEEHPGDAVLTADDRAFLTTLANTLKTQDRAGTAKPVIYQILERKQDVGYEEAFADGMALGLGNDGVGFYDDDVDGAKRFLIEHYDVDAGMLSDLHTLQDVADWCERHDIPAVYTGYRDSETFHGFFLTHAALQEHMQANAYHYTHPVSYAHYAGFRNPELERLLAIVEKFATVDDPETRTL